MLYVSTRNRLDTYTAYRALHEACAPDGGTYVPFHLPVFTAEEFAAMQGQSYCKTVAQVLNLFFGLRLSDLEVELAIGRNPVRLEPMSHKLQIVEAWRNPGMSAEYLLSRLYGLLTGSESVGTHTRGWRRIAIQIALLFGLATHLEKETQGFDIAVKAGDFSTVAAICFAKQMGFPADLIVCTSVDDSSLWDLLNRGECATSCENAGCWESVLHVTLGADTAVAFFNTCSNGKSFYIDEQQREDLQKVLFASVVSANRVDSVKSSIMRMNAYNASTDAALAFGGLQDYRSATGISKDTLILALTRPDRVKE